jgi:hypothetical protein
MNPIGELGNMIRTRCRGLVGAMIPCRLCCPGPGARPGGGG